MGILNVLLVISSLLVFCTAVPLLPKPKTNSSLSKRDQLDPKKVFQGIFWDDAESDCTADEYAILIEATRMADEMINFLSNTPNWWDTVAWNRYFVRNSNAESPGRWQDGTSGNRQRFVEIRNNVAQVSIYPKKGKPMNGQLVRRRQVAYSCGMPVGVLSSRCTAAPDEDGKWHGPTAETYNPRLTSNTGWAIEFCPRFFKSGELRYLNDITMSFKSESSLPILRSYEWAISHEWMHCRLFGYRNDIADLIGYDHKTVIYGDEACHGFAWFSMNKGKGDGRHNFVNSDTFSNADSYAWMYQYHWFRHIFGWGCKFPGYWL
jgi:hypothetical protein